MSDSADKLLKNEEPGEEKPHKANAYTNTKRKIREICVSLHESAEEYQPDDTVELIKKYINESEKMDRILYSEISKYIFSMSIKERATFQTNVESLLQHVLDESSVEEDCRKIVIKIYDHNQLALYQIENVTNIFASKTNDTKRYIESEIRSAEKEYVTILGIFAAIVLAFVGGITFSTQVLQNISAVSIYRLLLVIALLALVLLNAIWLLLKFLLVINNNESKFYNIYYINIGIIIIVFLIALVWMDNNYNSFAMVSCRLIH